MHPVKTECILTYYADYSIIMFMGIPKRYLPNAFPIAFGRRSILLPEGSDLL